MKPQNITIEDIHHIRLQHISFHQNNKHRFKVNRDCSGCKKRINALDVTFIGETKLGVWFNHNACKSTMIQMVRKPLKQFRSGVLRATGRF